MTVSRFELQRQCLEDWLHQVLRPDVSAPRQILAVLATAAALALAVQIYGRVSYSWCHLLAGAGVLWLAYACSSSPRLAAAFTVWSIFWNELVIDLAKPSHPDVDWDHLAVGIVGVALGYLALAWTRRIWPGREWTKKPRQPMLAC